MKKKFNDVINGDVIYFSNIKYIVRDTPIKLKNTWWIFVQLYETKDDVCTYTNSGLEKININDEVECEGNINDI